MKIDMTRTALPEEGKRVGVFVDAIPGKIQDKRDREVETLTLVAQLKKQGKEKLLHTVSREYRLDTKGLKKLKADFEGWLGNELTADQLEQFDPEAEFVGKSVIVNVVHATENGRPAAKFSEFGKTTEVVKAEGYIRVKDRENPAAVQEKGEPKG